MLTKKYKQSKILNIKLKKTNKINNKYHKKNEYEYAIINCNIKYLS
jgi:hypothetical protein